jgi:CDGSH-type Zn-finger protein
MPLSYDDLIEPTIVKQVSKSVAYCRCTRSKNLPFCDGSHRGINFTAESKAVALPPPAPKPPA